VNPYVNDYVTVLSSRGSARASRILESVKVEKQQIEKIVSKLNNSGSFSNLVIDREQRYSKIQSGKLLNQFRDVRTRIQNIFDSANDVSLVLDSYSDLLLADIKTLEDELYALEKVAHSYAFLLADNGAYDFASLEPFSDERGRDLEILPVPDRTGVPLDVSQAAAVKQDEGVLIIQGDATNSFPFSSARVIKNNAGALVTSDTGIQHAITKNDKTGWKLSVSSPAPITSRVDATDIILEANQTIAGPVLDQSSGLRVVVELVLDRPAPCDNLVITPFTDIPFTLDQVRLFEKAEEVTYKEALTGSMTVDMVRHVMFPMSAVGKVQLYLSAREYQRKAEDPPNSELITKHLPKPTRGPQDIMGYTFQDPDATQGDVLQHDQLWFGKQKPGPWSVSLPKTNFAPSWGWWYKTRSSLERKSLVPRSAVWDNSTVTSRVIMDVLRKANGGQAILDSVFHSDMHYRLPGEYDRNGNMLDRATDAVATLPPIVPSTSSSVLPEQQAKPDASYQYSIGIRNVQIGLNASRPTGYFVSKVLEAPGDIAQLRLKAKDTNIHIPGTNRDQDLVTSIEYSVTNITNPLHEADWIPVLPIDHEKVEGERLYLNEHGVAPLRFGGKLSAPMSLYQNGIKVDRPLTELIQLSPDKSYVSAMFLPKDLFATSDIMTCDYVPIGDPTTVDFTTAQVWQRASLISSFDADGTGQGFVGDASEISLAHAPYIDYAQVATSTYSSVYGLTPYTPVVVKFSDGTVASNLTNYSSGSQASLDPAASGVQFIHSDFVIKFNRIPGQAFRVFYHYVPNSVRFRVVLRSNYGTFTSPKVDYVQVKAKLRKSNAKSRF
jgi:hypothetical protein